MINFFVIRSYAHAASAVNSAIDAVNLFAAMDMNVSDAVSQVAVTEPSGIPAVLAGGGLIFSLFCIVPVIMCFSAKGNLSGGLLLGSVILGLISGMMTGGTMLTLFMILCVAAGGLSLYDNQKNGEKPVLKSTLHLF